MSLEDRERWERKYREGSHGASVPAPWVVDALDFLSSHDPRFRDARARAARGPSGFAPLAVDIACGRGRHVSFLRSRGLKVVGLDVAFAPLEAMHRTTADPGRLLVQGDTDVWPLAPESVDLVCCTQFLDRQRTPDMVACLRPGGYVIFETYTIGQAAKDWGPSRPAFLLGENELIGLFEGLQVVLYREADLGDEGALAGILARRPEQS